MIQSLMMNQMWQQIRQIQPSLVELTPGQVFQGKVLKLFPDNLATVQLGGLTVTARLETPLELGQRTWLQVQPDGQPVTLKVINQPGKPNQASESSMEGLTKALGLPVTKETVSFLQKAVDAGIPLRSDSLRAFQQLVQEVGSDPATEEAVLLALKKGLPLTKETVLALRTFAGNAHVGEGLERLVQTARAVLEEPDSVPSGLKEPLQQVIGRIDVARGVLVQVTQTLTQTAQAFTSPLTEEAVSPNQQHLSMPGTDRPFDIKQMMTELFQRLGVQHERSLAQAVVEEVALATGNVENVKAALLQVLQHPEANTLPGPLKEHMQQMVHQLTGQQLMLTGNQTDSAFMQIALQLPLPGKENGENAFIQIESRKRGQGGIDPENCRLFFYLSMKNIGETMLDVSIVNKILSIQLYNNDEQLVGLVRALRVPLEQNLAEQGYRLSNLRVSPLPVQQKNEKPSSSFTPFSSSLVNYKGVDFRV
jgi:hypothetical protein